MVYGSCQVLDLRQLFISPHVFVSVINFHLLCLVNDL